MPYLGPSAEFAYYSRYTYTASGSETSISGTDDNGQSLAFTSGVHVSVTLNGILLVPSTDYNTNTANTIAGLAALSSGDVLEVVVYTLFSVADAVPATGGTFSGNVTMNGDLTVDTDTLYVDSTNNRVGVGTSSPARGLHLNNNGESFFRITSSDTGNAGIEFGDQSDGVQGAIFQNSTDNSLRLNGYNNSEAMRIDSSGNALLNCTSARSQNTGVSSGILVQVKGDIVPDIDAGNVGHSDLGDPSYRFEDVYSRDAVTTGSDQNEKQQITSLTSAEITAAKAISKLFKTFKWNDSVTAKGANARTHTGVIAQQVETAMTDAGLDAGDYAFFISNTWWEADEDYTDDDGNAQTRTVIYSTQAEAPQGATERTRLGIRYPELLAFVGAATEQRLVDIETRLTALENA